MDRKLIFIIGGGVLAVIAIVILLVTSGCKKKETGEVVLTFWGINDKAEVLKPIIDDFQNTKKKQGVDVKINYVQKNLGSYEFDSLNMIASGKGPDIWAIPNSWITKHQNKLSPLTSLLDTKLQNYEYVKDNYPGIISSENVFNNQVYGLPLAADPLVIYFNKDLLEDSAASVSNDADRQLLSDPPANWDDLVRISKLNTQKQGSKITQTGATLGTAAVPHASDILTLLMLQFGAQMTSDDYSSATFHTNVNKFGGDQFPGSKALDFYTSFANFGSDNYSFSDSLGDAKKAFTEGKAALYIDYASFKSEIKTDNPKLNFDIAPLPQVKQTKNPVSLISYLSYTVPNVSSQKQLAWEFVMFLTDKNNAREYIIQNQTYPIFNDQIKSSTKDIADQITNAAYWHNPDAEKVNKIFRDAIAQVLEGQKTQTALDGAALEVTNLLKSLKEQK